MFVLVQGAWSSLTGADEALGKDRARPGLAALYVFYIFPTFRSAASRSDGLRPKVCSVSVVSMTNGRTNW